MPAPIPVLRTLVIPRLLVAGGCFSVLLLLPLLGAGQGRIRLRGSVMNEAGAAVEFATITLHRATDSVAVKSEFTDAQGTFQLEAPAGGPYLVSAAQVGFGRYWSPVLPAADNQQLPPIRLAASATTALQEVTVVARKPLYEHEAGRTVVNVADSPQASGATALDVLGRAPGISVGANEALRMGGRSGDVLVLIDGKRVPLSGNDLADYLKALPAEQLQSIELLTNPPAQYDAQGSAGVIAINLKKDQRQGTNGSYNLSYGRGEYGKLQAGLGLNYRRKKLNLFGNYAYADRRSFARNDFERWYGATAMRPPASTVLATEQLSQLRSHSGKLGLDFALTKRTQLAATAMALVSQTASTTTSQTQVFGPLNEPTDHYHSLAAQQLDRPSGSLNLNLRHAMADSAAAATLTGDADYARYHTTRQLALTTHFDVPTAASTLLDGDQRSDLSIGALKLDYSRPLPHRARLDAGLKATRVRSDNDVIFANTENGIRSINPAISSTFHYDENVNAAYLSYRSGPAPIVLQLGLRAEQTNIRAEVVGQPANERHYLQLFPSATVQRTLSERHALALTLARRIDRPTYGQLNPLRTYFDATSYRSGNPNLVAQTSYSAELTHTYRQKFTTALSYVQTNQPFVKVVQPSPDGGRLVVNQDVNLRTEHFYSLTLTAPFDLTKWCNLYANGVFYYARFVGMIAETNLDRGRAACNLTATGSFTLPHGWSADVNGVYESSEQFGFEFVRSRGQLSAGIQKSLWSKQATLRLNAADMLYTTPIRSTSTYSNFAETFYGRQDSRVVTAAFTYRFGNGKVAAARKRTAGAEDELRRASGL